MSKRVGALQRLFDNKKYRQLIPVIGTKPSTPFDLSYLRLSDGSIETNRNKMQEHVCKHGEDHHAHPKNLDAHAEHLANSPTYWSDLAAGTNVTTMTISNISPDMVARLQATCQCTLSAVAKTEIADSLHAPISEQDFTDALDHVQKKRAPGPSMVTTNMIRAWSPNTRYIAFVLLDNLWKNKEVPEWWADGVLCPIPKKPGDTTLQNNMRPIGLLEVIRKVWTGIIFRRIEA
jgi:hypothetical protein